MSGFHRFHYVCLPFFVVFLLIPCAQAQVTGKRVLAYEEYVPDMQFTVKLIIEGISDDVTVIEKVPPGWIIHQVYQRGVIDQEAGTITWKFANASGSSTLRYSIFSPEEATGDAIFSGTMNTNEITGLSRMPAAAPKPVGIFENHVNIGEFPPGEAIYDKQTGVYTIKGGGSGTFNTGGQYAYLKINGDFSLSATINQEIITDITPGAGAGLSFIDSLSSNALFFTGWMYAHGRSTDVVWREVIGSDFDYDGHSIPEFSRIKRIRIVRSGDLFSMFYFDPAETRWVYFLSREIHFTDPVYAALVVHAFANKDLFITAQFSDVQFSHLPDMSSMKNWELFK
ncbi:MAG TPA: hypothetical protein PLX83_17950 [bacterium]|nr:hypothetical protein [bacterium]